MSKSIRAFLGVKIEATPALREVLSQLDRMGGAVKAVGAERLHVTLKFLGDTAPETVPEVARVVEGAVRSREACRTRIAGLGAFPHAGRPSVVWAGVDGAETLIEIAEQLERDLEGLGFARENRRFKPHLTLARVRRKPPGELGKLLNEHAATEFGETTINAVKLLQSELLPDGPRYTLLSSAALE